MFTLQTLQQHASRKWWAVAVVALVSLLLRYALDIMCFPPISPEEPFAHPRATVDEGGNVLIQGKSNGKSDQVVLHFPGNAASVPCLATMLLSRELPHDVLIVNYRAPLCRTGTLALAKANGLKALSWCVREYGGIAKVVLQSIGTGVYSEAMRDWQLDEKHDITVVSGIPNLSEVAAHLFRMPAVAMQAIVGRLASRSLLCRTPFLSLTMHHSANDEISPLSLMEGMKSQLLETHTTSPVELHVTPGGHNSLDVVPHLVKKTKLAVG
jgi:hypothetical protein